MEKLQKSKLVGSLKLDLYRKHYSCKTLVIPKLNHLNLNIPNTSVEFIIAFERKLLKLCLDFVWNNKRDKIKRYSVVQDYKNMADLK